jgi:signal transduction histidine kinase
VVVTIGWITGYDLLKGVLIDGISVKANTGLLFIPCGIALVLLAEPRHRGLVIVARVLAGVAIVVGLATLSQHLGGWNLGIDEFVFDEVAGAAGTASPNRMGPPAAISFPLIGLALILLDRKTRSGLVPSQWLAVIATLISLIALLGYIFRVQALYGVARFTGISFPTAIAFAMLSAGILCARPAQGAMRRVVADDSGGLLIRRLLPAAILLPALLAYLRILGENAGLFDRSFGLILLVLSFIVAFSALVWLTGGVVSRLSAARAQAERAEAQLKVRLIEALESERAARATAERANLMKDEFLATLSHELRSPLQAIVGWAQLLVRGGLPERDVQRGLESIERNARLQAQLIEDLLDISRITTGKVHLDVRNVSLDTVIDSAMSSVAPTAHAKGIRLNRSLKNVPAVRGDPARLQQILFNLLTNAIKFTPAGGEVTVSLSSAGPNAEVRVTDTGVGILPQHLPHVFDRFRQADSSSTRRHGGLGLGLAIARQLIELHGGSVHVESDGEGKGATFIVRVPATPPASLESSTSPARTTSLTVPALHVEDAVLTGASVLVVDDDADARELAERLLRSHGADVRTADSMATALELVGQQPFDLVVSDIGMPEHDGLDLMRAIRSRGGTMPAIALTAFARPEDHDRVIAAGYQMHLAKPIDPAHFAAAAGHLVAEAHGGVR